MSTDFGKAWGGPFGVFGVFGGFRKLFLGGSFFAIGGNGDLEGEFPKGQYVPVFKDPLGNLFAVDVGAVGGAKVSDQ